jgi:O-antigen ligase
LAADATPALLRRGGQFGFAALAILAISTLQWNHAFPLTARLGVVALVIFAAIRPADALLTVAIVGPFSDVLRDLLGSPPFRAYEAVMLAFLTGWLLHAPPHRRGIASRTLLPPASLLVAIVAASILTLAMQLHAGDARLFWTTVARLRGGYLWIDDITGVVAGASIVEGIVLLVAVVELTEGAAGLALSLIQKIAVAAVIATGLSLMLAGGVALPSTFSGPAALGQVRYAAQFGDVNTARSYFVLLLGLSAGMAASSVGSRRRWWLAGVALILVGLGLTGAPRAGHDIRRDSAAASFRVIATHPLFGVGVGRYDAATRSVRPLGLSAEHGAQDAHDSFLQTWAELGAAGLLALLWLLATALRPAISALRDRRRDYVSGGLLAGALAFLITCTGGHALLVREAAFPFWMVVALAAVTAGSPPFTSGSRIRLEIPLVR